jgi:hypothetical protein
VTLTINREQAWIYDGSFDSFETYLTSEDPRRRPDSDSGRPVELFGAGFRHGFTAATFPENGPFQVGEIVLTNRSTFAAGFDTNGVLIDVSNNVGKLDVDAFEVKPFAIGTNASLVAGGTAPFGARLYFELEVSDPHIAEYLQQSLNDGIVRLVASSLEEGSFMGTATFAQFFTRDNVLADPEDVPTLDLDGEFIDSSPRLLGITWRDASATLRFADAHGPLVLELCDDLSTWTETTITPIPSATPGESEWTDPTPISNARYYRLKSL